MNTKTVSNYKVPNVQLRKAYNRTLKNANFRGTASFCCGPEDNGSSYVLCQECPLNKTDCENKYDVKYWRQWWKELTGEEDNNADPLQKVDMDNTVKVVSEEEAREIFDSHLQECDDVVNPRFKVIYTCLDNSHTTIKRTTLNHIFKTVQSWYKEEVIKWNSIADGDVSNIPDDFKDIYLKVLDSANNIIFFDEYTLASKGLKRVGWVKDKT